MVTINSTKTEGNQEENTSQNTPFSGLLCVSCGKVPLNVVEARCCSALFCWECGTERSVCPVCNKRIGLEDLHENVPLQKIIDRIEISCPYEGCVTRFPAGQRQEHDSICPFKPLVCANSMECGIILQKDLQNHLEHECVHRLVQCPFQCGKTLPIAKLMHHSNEECPNIGVDCPNTCGIKVARKDVEHHLSVDCLLSSVPCEYEEFGCQSTPLRVDYVEHVQNNVHEHMRLLKDRIQYQERVIRDLSQNNNNNNEAPVLDFSAAIQQGQAIANRVMDGPEVGRFLRCMSTKLVCLFQQFQDTDVATLSLMVLFVLSVLFLNYWIVLFTMVCMTQYAAKSTFGKIMGLVVLFSMPRCYLGNVLYGLFLVHRIAHKRR